METKQPIFAGYHQHDSQEFLNFVLDGLHEDLNRIKKKPYIEELSEEEAKRYETETEIANEWIRRRRMREHSLITDLFEGFYKNKTVCPGMFILLKYVVVIN